MDTIAQPDPNGAALSSLLAQIGLDPGLPWVWIGTGAPIRDPSAAMVFRMFVHVPETGPWPWPSELPIAPGTFGAEWRGYHFEALGLLRRIAMIELDFTWDDAPDGGPSWRAFNARTGDLRLDVALMWLRAYRAGKRRVPPLVAEQRWVPGENRVHDFFRVTISANELPTADDLKAAQRARAMLHKLQPALKRSERPRKGRVWARQDYLDWYREAGQSYARDGERLTLRHLGEAMGVGEDTAGGRLREPEVGLPWPPEAHLEVWTPDPDD
jgi:hypothetical protein